MRVRTVRCFGIQWYNSAVGEASALAEGCRCCSQPVINKIPKLPLDEVVGRLQTADVSQIIDRIIETIKSARGIRAIML